MKTIEVCLTPDLLHLHQVSNKLSVIIDVFRATSCMVTALGEGAKAVLPVNTIDECFSRQAQGYLAAGERNGIKVDGFDLGNSPLQYKEFGVANRNIVISTTNGTAALNKTRHSQGVIIASFLNLDAVVSALASVDHDILLLCSGWKGNPNTEDTLLAGAICHNLLPNKILGNDSAVLAQNLWEKNSNGSWRALALAGSHAERLTKLGNQADLDFCLQTNIYNVSPHLENSLLVI